MYIGKKEVNVFVDLNDEYSFFWICGYNVNDAMDTRGHKYAWLLV